MISLKTTKDKYMIHMRMKDKILNRIKYHHRISKRMKDRKKGTF